MANKSVPLFDLGIVHRPMTRGMSARFQEIFRANQFVLGKALEEFEKNFSAFSGVPFGVGVSSGAAALLLGLKVMGIGPGDEVLTTPFTFFASGASICHAGAKPVFVDVDPHTLNMDVNQLKNHFSRRTKGVLPVHIFGNPVDMRGLGRFSREHDLPVLVDACQAHGAIYRKKPIGFFGDLVAFSFYPTKNLGGFGDGGMIVTKNKKWAQQIQVLRHCGQSVSYRHDLLGYNARMDNLQAALLQLKLRKLTTWTRERRRLAALYRTLLASTPVRPLQETPESQAVYHLFVVRTPHRNRLKDFLASQGIQTGIHYGRPLHLEKAFSFLKYARGDFPETEKASREVLSLPLYPGLTLSSVKYVAKKVQRFFHDGLYRQ